MIAQFFQRCNAGQAAQGVARSFLSIYGSFYELRIDVVEVELLLYGRQLANYYHFELNW